MSLKTGFLVASKMPVELRRHAISHVAGLVLFRFENPMESGWLRKTIAKLPQLDLDYLVSEIDRLLNDTAPALAEKLWNRWLKEYWEMRLLGTPKPLSEKEATEMVYWSISLGKYLPEAVELIEQMGETVQFEHGDILYRIQQKGVAKSQPYATAKLVLFFFESEPKNFYPSEYTKQVWDELKAGGVQPELLMKIREAMLALGHDPEQEQVSRT